jgi:transposase-like protein
MLAVGVNAEGGREVLGLSAAPDGSEGSWPAFLQQLKDRGLSQVDLCVGGFDPDLRKAVAAIFPAAAYQGCILQLQRDVLSLVPAAQAYLAIELLQSIHLGDSRKSAVTRLVQAVAQLQAIQLPEAAALLGQIGEQTLSYYAYPENHWRRLNNLKPLHKVLREFRERARVLGSASDGAAAVLLVSARLRHIARTIWGRRRYLDMTSRKA